MAKSSQKKPSKIKAKKAAGGRATPDRPAAKAKSTAKAKGDRPIVSMLLEGGKTGLSFLVLPAGTSLAQLSKDTMAQAVIKKHAQKCDAWFSFGWVVGSTREVESAGYLSFDWHPDEELDRVIATLKK